MKHVAYLYGIPYFDGPVKTAIMDDRSSMNAERRFWMDVFESESLRVTLENGAEIFIPQEVLKKIVVVIEWVEGD